MGLFVLLAALFETIGDSVKESVVDLHNQEAQRRFEQLDFGNIASVTLDAVEPAYSTVTDEEFDIVASDFLTQQDGWQHYETKTVERVVEDGENYCFTITLKNGSKLYRKYHSSRPITQKLLNFQNKAPGTVVIEYADGTKKTFEFEDEPETEE